MEGTTILAIALAVPVILFPAALVWHFAIAGAVGAAKRARKVRPVTVKA